MPTPSMVSAPSATTLTPFPPWRLMTSTLPFPSLAGGSEIVLSAAAELTMSV
ncbi:MAG: hypothetical protein ACK56I_05060 [bacterium]